MWTNESKAAPDWATYHPEIDPAAAAARISGKVTRTPIEALPPGDSAGRGLRILGKMENRQVTGSFKSRGALNNLLTLDKDERARGVVASSSGNHGRALAWAAKASGVASTIVMPKDAYPNKIAACRESGAHVVLAENRWKADEVAAEFAGAGMVWVHPYDRAGTVEGAGTVGLEIAEDLAQVDAVVLCVGGGGLSSGSALALRRALGNRVVLFGVEPVGADAMSAGLRKGESVHLPEITSQIQGLTTPHAGHLNVEINLAVLDGTHTVTDEAIYAAQKALVNDDGESGWSGEVVEPAGAAAYAAALDPAFAGRLRQAMEARGLPRANAQDLTVCVTVSGGNPAPAQLAELRA